MIILNRDLATIATKTQHLNVQNAECKKLLDGMYYILMGKFVCEQDYNVSTCRIII